MPNLGATEILLIFAVVLLLFGSKKLPDLSRSIGRSLRIFKAETKGLRDDDRDEPTAEEHPAAGDERPRRLTAADGTPTPSATSAAEQVPAAERRPAG